MARATAAEALIAKETQRHPSLLGFERLLEARMAINQNNGKTTASCDCCQFAVEQSHAKACALPLQ